MSKVYAEADKALKRLYSYAESQFRNLALMAQWDELNVIRSVRTVYEQIGEYALENYKQIARRAYQEARRELHLREPEAEEKDFGLLVLLLLSAYEGKTEYRYDHEWGRKRDRLAESLISIPDIERIANSNAIRTALNRALNLMSGQLRNMADTVTDEMRIEAFHDAGISYVQWHTQQDNRVCADCADRNDQIYPLYGVPTKHRRCRCYLTAV